MLTFKLNNRKFVRNCFACRAPGVIRGQSDLIIGGGKRTEVAGEGILHLGGCFYAIEIGEDLEGLHGFARLFQLHRVMVREGIVFCRAEFDGNGFFAFFVRFGHDGVEALRKNGGGIVFGITAVFSVGGQMSAVTRRMGDLPRRIDRGFVVEVHAVDTHIAVFVDLADQTLRKFKFVLHRRQRSHVFIIAVFDRHIADGAATDGRERGLHNASGIVEREVQMSAEGDDLIIFGKNVGQIARYPHILERRAGFSAERASVNGVVDHGVCQNDHVSIGIFGRDLRESLIQPIFRCLRVGYVGIRDGKKRDDVIAVDHTMTVALRFQRVTVNVLQKVIGTEHFVELVSIDFRFCAPVYVMVADREDHGHFLRIKNAFVNLFINVDLFEFTAVTACVDQVTDGEDRVDASEFLDLCERVREKGFVTAGVVVAHMNVADRGKRKNDFGFIECIFHKRFLSACHKQVCFYLILYQFLHTPSSSFAKSA